MNFYIEQANLTIDIENRMIASIMRGKSENAIELDALDATFYAVHIDRETRKLYLDGLALVALAEFLHRERPGTFKSEAHRLLKLFCGSSDINDLMRATCRVVAGIDHEAPGEAAHFCGKVRDAHPIHFALLRAGWTAKYCNVQH